MIALKYENGFDPPFFEGTHWGVPIPPETRDGLGSMFADPNEYGVDGRAVMYHMAYFSPKVFGGGQFYLMNISDRAGKPLEGNKTYRLTVPAERADRAVLVGDGVRPRNARADPRRVPPEPRVERHGRAEKCRRLGRHLLRPDGAGGQGIQLGADRSEAAVRTAVPPLRPEEGAVREDVEAAGCRTTQLTA